MSTSPLGALVRAPATVYGAAADPVSAGISRRVVANGLLHCADEYAQVRVNYHPIAAAVAGEQSTFETIETSPTNNTWYRVGGSPFGAWPLTQRADGTPYKLRVRVGVGTSAASSTLTMRIVVAPLDETIAVAARDAETDNVYELTWSGALINSTPDWVEGASQGTAASATLITVSQDQALDWTRSVSTYDAVSGASPVSVQQVPLAAHVWAKTSTGALPRLHALYVAEFVGT